MKKTTLSITGIKAFQSFGGKKPRTALLRKQFE